MTARKLILYISMSLDGYLATKDDDLSFLNGVQREGEDYGYAAFTENVDTYLVGRTTYEVVKGLLDGDFPQGRQYDCYVITRQDLPPENGVQFYNGDLTQLIRDLKARPGKDIYCDGGGEVVRLLLERHLIDELIVSVIPHLLGDGKRLFKPVGQSASLRLLSTKTYDSGLVQLRYERI